MTSPVTVEIARRLPDGTVEWVDATCDVVSIQTSAGRQHALDRYRAAVARFRLYNPTGIWSPWYTGGPYEPLDAGDRIRVTFADAETVLPVATVAIDTANDVYEPLDDETVRAYVDIDAVDDLESLSMHDGDERPAVGAGESTGDRIARLLDDAGWTGPTALDPGVTTMQPTTLAGRTLDEIWITADSDGGSVFVDASGTFVFRDATSETTRSRSLTPVAVFSTDPEPGQVCIADMRLACDREILVNEARIARAGGTARRAVSPASVERHGPRTFARSDLRHDTDDHSSRLAAAIVARGADTVRRITGLVVDLYRHPEHAALICGIGFGDLIEVHHSPPGGWQIATTLVVHGIEHRIAPGEWSVAFATGNRTAADATAEPQKPTGVTVRHLSATEALVSWTPASLGNESGFHVAAGGNVYEAGAGVSDLTIPVASNVATQVTVTAWNGAGTAAADPVQLAAHRVPTPVVTFSTSWPAGTTTLTYSVDFAPDAATACPNCGPRVSGWTVTVRNPSAVTITNRTLPATTRTVSGTATGAAGNWTATVVLTDHVGTATTTVTRAVPLPTATVKPPAVTGLTLTTSTAGLLRVAWTEPAQPAAPNQIDSVTVYYRLTGTTAWTVGLSRAWQGGARTYDVPNPSAGKQYDVLVRTRNEAGFADASATAWTRPAAGTVVTIASAWIDTHTSARGWRGEAALYTGTYSSFYGDQAAAVGWGANMVNACHGHTPTKVEVRFIRATSGGMLGADVAIAAHTANAKPGGRPATSGAAINPALEAPAPGTSVWVNVSSLNRAGMASGAVRGLLAYAPNASQANYATWSAGTLQTRITF